MLHKIFHVVDGVTLLDEKSLLENTDQQFVSLVAPLIGGSPIKQLRMNGGRKDAFMFFTCRGNTYSFAYNRNQLIFSRQERGRWHFVVGWMDIADNAI
jgi:hypothetical protein